jgi:hypothetical protein
MSVCSIIVYCRQCYSVHVNKLLTKDSCTIKTAQFKICGGGACCCYDIALFLLSKSKGTNNFPDMKMACYYIYTAITGTTKIPS